MDGLNKLNWTVRLLHVFVSSSALRSLFWFLSHAVLTLFIHHISVSCTGRLSRRSCYIWPPCVDLAKIPYGCISGSPCCGELEPTTSGMTLASRLNRTEYWLRGFPLWTWDREMVKFLAEGDARDWGGFSSCLSKGSTMSLGRESVPKEELVLSVPLPSIAPPR